MPRCKAFRCLPHITRGMYAAWISDNIGVTLGSSVAECSLAHKKAIVQLIEENHDLAAAIAAIKDHTKQLDGEVAACAAARAMFTILDLIGYAIAHPEEPGVTDDSVLIEKFADNFDDVI